MKYFIILFVILSFSAYIANSVLTAQGTTCQCIKYDCGCCLLLDIQEIKLKGSGCVNITYLPDQYGFSLTLSIDNVVYINKTISARNPPPICVGLPHLEKEAGICVDFYNLDVSHHTISGCVQLEATLYHTTVAKVKVGCFKIPLARNRHGQQDALRKFVSKASETRKQRNEKFSLFQPLVNILP